MRITQNIIYGDFLRNINQSQNRISALQNQLSSGKKVTKASDDAVSFSAGRRIKESLRQAEQFQRNIDSGLGQAREVQRALDSMIDIMIDIQGKAITGASETNGAQQRQALGNEVSRLKEQLVDLANTDFNGVHLFGGTNTLTPPFTLDPAGAGGVLDNSSTTRLSVAVSDTLSVDVSVTGSELRQTPQGDLFELISALEIGLNTNNTNAINQSIEEIKSASDHITDLASQNGSHINQMEFLFQRIEGEKIDSAAQLSTLIDTDFTEAVSELSQQNSAFEAALASQAQFTRTSLLNFL